MTFRILTVCTGNICRSPLAEQLLRRELAGLAGVEVASAGVGALVGDGMPEPALRVARSLGVEDASEHRARQLTAAMISESDLVLAMARDHRRTIVETVPSAMRRVFTLRELAHIADFLDEAEISAAVRGAASPDEALRALVALAALSRGMAPPPPDQADWDVVDPYRRSDEVYERSAQQLAPAAAGVASFLRRTAD